MSAFTLHALPRMLCAVMVVVLSAPVFVTAAAATPTNAEIEAARQDAAQARKEMEELQVRLEERAEEYLAVEQALSLTRQRIKVAEEELRAAESQLNRAQELLNERVASAYRSDGVDMISVMLGVTDFQDFVTRLELLRRISASDAALVSGVKFARSEAEKKRHSLEASRLEQVVLLRHASEKKQEVEAALASQRSYLAGINDKVKQLIAEERERQERIARERAAADAARAAEQARVTAQQAAAGRAKARTPGPGDSARHGTDGGSRPTDASTSGAGGTPLPGARKSVLQVARSFIGVTPYIWGGVTPAGFDCSGLTMYCFREIGINIPRTSRQQYNHGSRIPADRLDLLQPGDLVFFARDADPGLIHHVGIYSGDGNYVHAPQAGELVSESSLLARIARRGDYVGAVRP